MEGNLSSGVFTQLVAWRKAMQNTKCRCHAHFHIRLHISYDSPIDYNMLPSTVTCLVYAKIWVCIVCDWSIQRKHLSRRYVTLWIMHIVERLFLVCLSEVIGFVELADAEFRVSEKFYTQPARNERKRQRKQIVVVSKYQLPNVPRIHNLMWWTIWFEAHSTSFSHRVWSVDRSTQRNPTTTNAQQRRNLILLNISYHATRLNFSLWIFINRTTAIHLIPS